MFSVPERFRVAKGYGASTKCAGNNGMFIVRSLKIRNPLIVQASDGIGWEHVSVSLPDRCPTWEEMLIIKNLFWGDEDLVVQFHPPEKDCVNIHPYCLHLWRKAGTNDFVELPPIVMV